MPKKPKYDPQDFPAFAVTVDLVILTIRDGQLHALAVRRSESPYKGKRALPGGFVQPETDLLESAMATLASKTGVAVDSVHLEQLATFGKPGRDPRMRVVSVAYLAFAANLPEPAGELQEKAQWVPLVELRNGAMAFDHQHILDQALERARSRIEYTTLATCFCAPAFTMAELRSVFEIVWDTQLDPANFDRKIRATEDFVVETGDYRKQAKGRPARTYCKGKATQLSPPIRRGC